VSIFSNLFAVSAILLATGGFVAFLWWWTE
jgi:hypothetical protein